MEVLSRPSFHDSEVSKTKNLLLASSFPLSMLASFIKGSTKDCANSFISTTTHACVVIITRREKCYTCI